MECFQEVYTTSEVLFCWSVKLLQFLSVIFLLGFVKVGGLATSNAEGISN